MADYRTLAHQLHEGYVLPLINSTLGRATLLRVDYVVIGTVDIPNTVATFTFANGTQATAPFGIVAPNPGERWRLLTFKSGGSILDDWAPDAN